MVRRHIFSICIFLVAVILLGEIAIAQQGSVFQPNGSQRPSESVREGRNPRPFGERLRGLLPGRNHQEIANTSPDVDQPASKPIVVVPQPQPETTHLKELAEWLSIPIPDNATPDTIA